MARIARPRKTVEDYLALPDDVRAELIDGELYVMSAPTPHHQDVAGRLYVELLALGERSGLGRAYISPIDVYLPTGDIVQPDVILIREARFDIIRDAIRGAPDLAVEVLSPSRPQRDRLVKRDLYARAGIPEYWIADGGAASIEVFRLRAGRYEPAGWFTGTATVRSPTLDGLAVPLAHVFRRDA